MISLVSGADHIVFSHAGVILVSHFSSLFDSKMIFGFNEFPNHSLTYSNFENDFPTNDKNRFPLTGTIDEIGGYTRDKRHGSRVV